MAISPTPEEMAFLNNFDLRQTTFKDNPLVIRNRLFDHSVRFDPFQWENTQFIDCDFNECLLFHGILKNVRFENCAFATVRFEEGEWDSVSFIGCAARGNFNMGPRIGKNTLFDDCEFIGTTPAQLGYGGVADSYGGIGGTNGAVLYRKCHLERVYVNGGSSLVIQDSKMIDAFGKAKKNATLLLQNVEGQGLVAFNGQTSIFSTVTVKNSNFKVLSFEDATIGNASFENIRANLGLSIVKAENVMIKNVTLLSEEKPDKYLRYGLNTNSAKIKKLAIENCLFEGKQVALNLLGDRDMDKDDAPNGILPKDHVNVYSTTIGTLTIRNTPIIRGRMEYMEVGTLLLENLAVQGANFSHGEFGQFILRNVLLSGEVDFTGTKIRERIYDRVENTSTGNQPTILKP